MESITSRRPSITRAKKSIDQFKLRVHTPLGCKLTLRSSSSFFFFHRLVHFVLPRLEDLSFLSSSFLPPSSDLRYPRLPFSSSSPLVISSLSSTLSVPNTFSSPLYKRFSFSSSSSSLFKLHSFFRFLRFHTFFFPFFKSYFTLPFSDSLLTFFLDSSLSLSSPLSPLSSPSPLNVSSKSSFYSFSFGLSDFFTSFSTDFDKFHSSYGLDITFVIRFSNHPSLSHPFYFLSFFQFPLI